MANVERSPRAYVLAAACGFALFFSQNLIAEKSCVAAPLIVSSYNANDQQSQEFEKSLKALRGDDVDQKHSAVLALGRSDNPAAVEPLINALGDQDVFVRSFAAIALGNLKDKRAVAPLIKALGDENQRVRRSAAESLGAFRSPDAVNPLIKALDDENIFVQRSVEQALGNIGTPQVVDPLIKALGDEDDYISSGASAALMVVGKAGIPQLVNALGDWILGPRVAEVLESFNWQPSSDEEKVRYYVAIRDQKSLMQNWESARKVLTSDANNANGRQNENAIYALIGIGRNESLEDLAAILRTNGKPEMARAFVESGNARLAELAQNWAKEHGSTIQARNSADIVKWGEMKP